MHELSVAQSIVEIVNNHLPKDDRCSVKSVRLKVGELAGVIPESLSFCFTAITQGTPLQGANVDIERVPFTITCEECRATSPTEYGSVQCPACGSVKTKVASGTELQVIEIELND